MDAIITLIILMVLSGAFDKKKRQERRQRRVDEQREKMQRYEEAQRGMTRHYQEVPRQESMAELDEAERRARLQELRKRAAARQAAEAAEQQAAAARRMPQQQSLSFDAPAAEGPQAECYGAEDRHSPLSHRPTPTSQPHPDLPPSHPQKVQPAAAAASSGCGDISAQLRDPQQLRRAMILAEVLGPPKALRKR